MNKVTERKRLRREYLKRGGAGSAMQGVGILIAIPALLFTLLFGLCTLWATTAILFGWGRDAHPEDDPDMLKMCGVITLVSGLTTVCGVALQRRGVITKRIPYVPPVTVDTLPAEEILVRAADVPPVMQSDVLLRAVQGQETPKEELLRVSQGE